MSNYVKITDYAAKDALLTGNPSKVVSGTEIGADFDAVATAVATKVDSGGALGTPSSGTLTNCTGTAAGLTAGTVTTNANLTGHVTSVGNAAVLGSFTIAQLNTAVSDANVARSGANSDITSLTGLTTPLSAAQGGTGTTTGVREIQPISASVGSSALTISASALSLDFRSTTAGSGTVTKVSGTPANLVISSGSTLGTTSAQLSRLAVLALNNAGTIELAVVNIASGLVLDETGLISTTAEGGAGAADSATVVYSTTARTNVAYRVIGYVESTQATAGTWATAPSAIQGAGGNKIITSRITTSATVATTSGTSIDVTGIPPWVKRITIILNDVSSTGTSPYRFQLGTASGVSNSGYGGASTALGAGATTGNISDGFGIYDTAAAQLVTGIVIITFTGTSWIATGLIAKGNSAAMWTLAGTKALTGVLDRVRLTTTGGVDTFDNGALTVTWE